MSDLNVEAVIARLRERSERGLEKYGVDTTRSDLNIVDWLSHLQEEMLDAAVYLEVLIKREARQEVAALSDTAQQETGDGSCRFCEGKGTVWPPSETDPIECKECNGSGSLPIDPETGGE